jgi:hypothetical protein
MVLIDINVSYIYQKSLDIRIMTKIISKDAYRKHQGETISQVYNCESGLGDDLSRVLSSKGCAMCNKEDNLKYCEKCKCSMVINPKDILF